MATERRRRWKRPILVSVSRAPTTCLLVRGQREPGRLSTQEWLSTASEDTWHRETPDYGYECDWRNVWCKHLQLYSCSILGRIWKYYQSSLPCGEQTSCRRWLSAAPHSVSLWWWGLPPVSSALGQTKIRRSFFHSANWACSTWNYCCVDEKRRTGGWEREEKEGLTHVWYPSLPASNTSTLHSYSTCSHNPQLQGHRSWKKRRSALQTLDIKWMDESMLSPAAALHPAHVSRPIKGTWHSRCSFCSGCSWWDAWMCS